MCQNGSVCEVCSVGRALRRAWRDVLSGQYRLRGPVRPLDEVRSVVGLDYTIGLLVSIAMLAYLVIAMVMPEKF